MSLFLSISAALFAGLMLTRVFKWMGFNFPDVTAFLIAGLLIGPYGLGRLGINGFGFVSEEAVRASARSIRQRWASLHFRSAVSSGFLL